jgi:hypothetical protein
VPTLGTAQKVHLKFLQVYLSPGQGGVVPGIIKLHQQEVKLAAAKRTEEVGSDAIDSFIVSFFPSQNWLAVSLPARHPGWGGVGRLAGSKKSGQFIQIMEPGHGKADLLFSKMTCVVEKMTCSAGFSPLTIAPIGAHHPPPTTE